MAERDRTVLVTGSAGLLGGEVVRDLIGAGYAVTALDRVAEGAPEGARFVQDDLAARERLEALLAGVGGVIHCAAYPSVHAAHEDIVFNANVTTTANLLFAAEAIGVPRFILASSQSALGFAYASEVIAPDILPVDETHPCRPHEGYALSKIVGEQLCAMVSARSTLTARCLRFPVIWSPSRFAEHTAKRLGDPEQAAKSQWAYVDVRDAARACRIALRDPSGKACEVYNIAAPWPFACGDARRSIESAYGAAPRRPGFRPGDAMFDPSKARSQLGFTAVWRWVPERIEHVPAA